MHCNALHIEVTTAEREIWSGELYWKHLFDVQWWKYECWILFSDERQGTLRLSNLTKSMSGKYICRASNTAGTDSCHINLEVSTRKYQSQRLMSHFMLSISTLTIFETELFLVWPQLTTPGSSRGPRWGLWWVWWLWSYSWSLSWGEIVTLRMKWPMISSESLLFYHNKILLLHYCT